MEDYDIRFVNGNTITYVRRAADAADFADAATLDSRDYSRASAIDYGVWENEDGSCASAVDSNTYSTDDLLWVIDSVSADRTNNYEADTRDEWILEIVDEDCTWDSAITTDRSNVDAVQLDWGTIRQAFSKENTYEYSRSIKSSEVNEPQEIEDEKGGALDDFLDSFGGE